MFVSLLLCLFLATTGFAIPSHHRRFGTPVSSNVLEKELPPNQSVLVAPANATAKAVVVGVGNQNYTCTSGSFSSIGAVATMFDISNLDTTSTNFATIQDRVHDAWVLDQATDPQDPEWISTVQTQFGLQLEGVHTFVTFNGGAAPKFDFSQSTGNPGDFMIGKKAGDLPSPTLPAVNVDWLHLTSQGGQFATDAFRVLTVGGVQPAQCSGSENTTVKYTAQYFFF